MVGKAGDPGLPPGRQCGAVRAQGPQVRLAQRGGSCILGFCVPGCVSFEGPESVRGPVRGSLTVRCRYDPGWEAHDKYWCRGAVWHRCKVLVQTSGSEQEVRKDRVSLRDSQRDRVLTVTMEELKPDDRDIYWCGIERVGTDQRVRVDVIIDPGKSFLVHPTRPSCSGLSEGAFGGQNPCARGHVRDSPMGAGEGGARGAARPGPGPEASPRSPADVWQEWQGGGGVGRWTTASVTRDQPSSPRDWAALAPHILS